MVYLHGLEDPKARSEEEHGNRRVLEKLADTFAIRIALPQSLDLCEGKRCWPGHDSKEVARTYAKILEAAERCGPLGPSFALLGFSNGGYFAFKLYRWQEDSRLKWVLASGSAGTWSPPTDKLRPDRVFRLMIGQRELTKKAALSLTRQLRRSLPKFQLDMFAGKHELNYEATAGILRQIMQD